MEKFMRNFVSPVHCKHVFNVMLKQVGPQRPEMKILGEFCCLTRRTYLHAKLVKIRIENKDELFSIKDLEKSVNNLQGYMYELKQSFQKMCKFCCNLPPFFDNPDLSEFVNLLLDYFMEGTGQHSEFVDVLTSLLDEGLEILSNHDSKRGNDDDSFNAKREGEHDAGGAFGKKSTVTFQENYQAVGWGASPDNEIKPLPRSFLVVGLSNLL